MIGDDSAVVSQDDLSSSPRQTVVRTRPANNAAYLAGSALIGRLASFVFVYVALRLLGSALYGNFTATYNYVSLFALFTDLGLATVVARDVIQDRSLIVRYLSNLLVLRVMCAAIAVVVSIVIAQWIIAPSLRNTVYIAAISLIFLSISETLGLVFSVHERFAYTAIFAIATALLSVGVRLLALVLGYHVLALVTIQTATTFIGALAMTIVVYTRFLPRRLEIDLTWWPTLLRRAFPFFMSSVLNTVYAQGDKQILYVMSGCGQAARNAGCRPVGLYNAAYLPLDVLTVVFVISIQTATFSSFSRVAAESREALNRVVRSTLVLILVGSPPVALFISFYAPVALGILGGRHSDYVSAAPALSVLIWALPCFLIMTTLYNGLWAMHRAKIVTIAFGVAVVFNVGLNILLIPRLGYMACSILTVASEFVNAIVVARAVGQTIGSLNLMMPALKTAGVIGATSLVLWLLRPYGIGAGMPVGILMVVIGYRVTALLGTTEREVLRRLPVVGRIIVGVM